MTTQELMDAIAFVRKNVNAGKSHYSDREHAAFAFGVDCACTRLELIALKVMPIPPTEPANG